MTINEFKELEKVIQLCRKLGVETFSVGEISFTLGPNPKQPRRKKSTYAPENDFPEANIKIPLFTPMPQGMPRPPDEIIKADGLTQEQLLYYSVNNPDTEANEG